MSPPTTTEGRAPPHGSALRQMDHPRSPTTAESQRGGAGSLAATEALLQTTALPSAILGATQERSSRSGEAQERALGSCANGGPHTYNAYQTPRAAACTQCRQIMQKGTLLYGCELCDANLCGHCYGHIPQVTIVPNSSEAARTQPLT